MVVVVLAERFHSTDRIHSMHDGPRLDADDGHRFLHKVATDAPTVDAAMVVAVAATTSWATSSSSTPQVMR